jgi:hypothetical protein
MFGIGLQLVRLNSDELDKRLVNAVRSAWEQAVGVRPALLARCGADRH